MKYHSGGQPNDRVDRAHWTLDASDLGFALAPERTLRREIGANIKGRGVTMVFELISSGWASEGYDQRAGAASSDIVHISVRANKDVVLERLSSGDSIRHVVAELLGAEFVVKGGREHIEGHDVQAVLSVKFMETASYHPGG